MLRIMRSGFLNILLLFVLSTNFLNSLHAQQISSSPSPSPSPSPVPSPISPSPSPIHSPPSPSPSPRPNAPTPNLSPPPKSDVPTSTPPVVGEGGSSGLTGGQKAGIVIGTILGASVLVSLGMVYRKRQKNLKRRRYSNAARNFEL